MSRTCLPLPCWPHVSAVIFSLTRRIQRKAGAAMLQTTLYLGDDVSEEVQSAIESGELPLVPLCRRSRLLPGCKRTTRSRIRKRRSWPGGVGQDQEGQEDGNHAAARRPAVRGDEEEQEKGGQASRRG
eukprot:5478362-Pleurochrysis_carterae.AAC.4